MAEYDFNLAPVHGIRRYLWAALVKNNIIDESRYGGLVPIISVQETPEVQKEIALKGNPPFIVYNWTTDSEGDNWFIETDQIVFLIYSPNRDELRKIINFTKEIFKRKDDSAAAVNDYLMNLNNPKLLNFDYKSISVVTSGAPLPIESEGGNSEAMITISVKYTQDEVFEDYYNLAF